jgi:nitrate/TMAO reductase-like tetraheme cytochrome c subunit
VPICDRIDLIEKMSFMRTIAKKTMLPLILACAAVGIGLTSVGRTAPTAQKIYPGTEACRQCHEDRYAYFSKYSNS